MYAVIDLSQIPVCKSRGEAERFLQALRVYNTEAKWQLVVGIESAPLDALERLYALATMLMEASGMNPLTIGIAEAKLDGTEEQFSAVTVLHESRLWLDQVQDTH
jgi:hypothetical protein